MKKVENLLVLPILFLILFSFFSSSTTDIHLHDTYFVISNAWLAMLILPFVLLLLLLYKLVRNRHGQVNQAWAITHFLTTAVLLLIIWFSTTMLTSMQERMTRTPVSYVDLSNEFNGMPVYGMIAVIAILAFVTSQLVIFIYLIIRLFKAPQT